MNSTPPEPPRMLDRRKLLWWAFWFVFLTTPVFGVLIPTVVMPRLPIAGLPGFPMFLLCLGSIVSGAFAAGFLLSRLTSKSTSEFILRGFGFGFGITTLYAIIAFAGCLVIMRK